MGARSRPSRLRSARPLAPRHIAALLSLALLPACGGPSEPGPPRPPDLTGSWEWVRSLDRVSGQAKTPLSEGYAANLVLSGDPEAGSFEYRRDGEVVVAGTFTLAYEDAPGNNFVLWDPPFEFHGEMQWVALGADTLILADAAANGYESAWAR